MSIILWKEILFPIIMACLYFLPGFCIPLGPVIILTVSPKFSRIKLSIMCSAYIQKWKFYFFILTLNCNFLLFGSALIYPYQDQVTLPPIIWVPDKWTTLWVWQGCPETWLMTPSPDRAGRAQNHWQHNLCYICKQWKSNMNTIMSLTAYIHIWGAVSILIIIQSGLIFDT